MAVPKRKHSKSRKNKRRSKLKINSPAIIACPSCKKSKRPHFLCPHCKT